MRCPKCNYFFSEELRTCPKCGVDVGAELEKLGYFPPVAKQPFLFPEDFKSPPITLEKMQSEGGTPPPKPMREIEFKF